MQSQKDIEVHEKKYQRLLSQDSNSVFKPRVKIFHLFEKKIGKIHGEVLDIGSGNGYASVWLALNSKANTITSNESSDICVNELIPKNSKYFNVENKILPIKGNFSKLNYSDYFNFVVSFGSVHHSDCLFETMKSISKYLKEDGYLIMNEPSMSNYTTNKEYIAKYDKEEVIEGVKMKNFDRNDKFYRDAEYITAGYYAGLDLKYCSNFNPESISKKIIKVLKLILFLKIKEIIKLGKSKKNKPKSKIYFFQKKKTKYIPHKWTGL